MSQNLIFVFTLLAAGVVNSQISWNTVPINPCTTWWPLGGATQPLDTLPYTTACSPSADGTKIIMQVAAIDNSVTIKGLVATAVTARQDVPWQGVYDNPLPGYEIVTCGDGSSSIVKSDFTDSSIFSVAFNVPVNSELSNIQCRFMVAFNQTTYWNDIVKPSVETVNANLFIGGTQNQPTVATTQAAFAAESVPAQQVTVPQQVPSVQPIFPAVQNNISQAALPSVPATTTQQALFPAAQNPTTQQAALPPVPATTTQQAFFPAAQNPTTQQGALPPVSATTTQQAFVPAVQNPTTVQEVFPVQNTTAALPVVETPSTQQETFPAAQNITTQATFPAVQNPTAEPTLPPVPATTTQQAVFPAVQNTTTTQVTVPQVVQTTEVIPEVKLPVDTTVASDGQFLSLGDILLGNLNGTNSTDNSTDIGINKGSDIILTKTTAVPVDPKDLKEQEVKKNLMGTFETGYWCEDAGSILTPVPGSGCKQYYIGNYDLSMVELTPIGTMDCGPGTRFNTVKCTCDWMNEFNCPKAMR